MTPSALNLLDQAELLQLATNASAIDDDATAIAYLKEAVSRPDANGIAHYLLGAHYAQIRMYDRAVGAMEDALALDPTLSIARFQLGLLWLTSGVADKARAVFEPLAELPITDCLRHFGSGLCHMMQDRFDETERDLRAGIALNDSNAALNVDMQRVLDEVARVRAEAAPAASAPQPGRVLDAAVPDAEAPQESGHHVLLSIYGGNQAQ